MHSSQRPWSDMALITYPASKATAQDSGSTGGGAVDKGKKYQQ